MSITCTTSGRGQIILGDSDGYIHTINRHFLISSFKAFEVSVTHVYQSILNPILISAGADEPGINPMIKIWNQEKHGPNKRGSNDESFRPLCTRVFRATPGPVPTPINCIGVLDNLSHFIIGFGDGNLQIIKGDVTRERNSKTKVIKCSDHPITGLTFKQNG